MDMRQYELSRRAGQIELHCLRCAATDKDLALVATTRRWPHAAMGLPEKPKMSEVLTAATLHERIHVSARVNRPGVVRPGERRHGRG